MKLILIAFCVTLGYVSSAQVDMKKGLVMHLSFDGDAKDISGYGNHGTVYGATLTTDKSGAANSAYLFNRNSYINIDNSSTINSDTFSLCAKVYPQGFYNGQYYVNTIATKGYEYWITGQYALQFDPLFNEVAPSAYVATAPGYYQDSLNQTFTGYCYNAYPNAAYFDYMPRVEKNRWYCVTLTAATDSIRFYLDGIKIYAYRRSGALGTNSSDLRLGLHENPRYPYCFIGKMDDVRYYNRALNTDEVTAYCDYTTTAATTITTRPSLVTITPNPVSETLQLQFRTIESSLVSISVRDISGKIIEERQIHSLPGSNALSFNAANWAPGGYVLIVTEANGVSSKEFFVKK